MKQLLLPGIDYYDSLEEDRKLMLEESEKCRKACEEMWKKMRNITADDLKFRVK